MQRIQLQLLEMTDVQVVTRPYVIIKIGTDSSSALDQANGSSDTTFIIILAIVIPCVVLVIIAILIYASYNSYGNKLSTRYQPVHPVYILRRWDILRHTHSFTRKIPDSCSESVYWHPAPDVMVERSSRLEHSTCWRHGTLRPTLTDALHPCSWHICQNRRLDPASV